MLRIQPGKPLTCKLYLRRRGRRRPYYKVLVFSSRRELCEFGRAHAKLLGDGIGSRSRYWRGAWAFARRFRYPERHGPVGVILFCREGIGSGIVAHEMAHAALFWITPVGWPKVIGKGQNERLAWAVGELVRQFWRWHYRLPGTR